MQLCIDIGNTRVKTAVFEGDEILHLERNAGFLVKNHQQLMAKYHIKNIILSSTRATDENIDAFIKSHPHCIVLNHLTPLPITLQYQSPETLGKDRVAAAVAANALFPGEPVVFIDAGTCITTNLIDAKGCFLGGNISPGITMRLKAMHHYTGKLPLVEAEYHNSFLGFNTVSALQNGAVRGAIYEIASFLEESRKNFPDARIVLTGGDAILFAKHLKIKIFANPNLVLLGLNKILRFNAETMH